MSSSKRNSLYQIQKELRENGTVCAFCKEGEERPANLYWRKKPICNECMNPNLDEDEDYMRRLQTYWVEPKSSIQQVMDVGGWGDV